MGGEGKDGSVKQYRVARSRLQHGYLLGGVLIAFGVLILTVLGAAIPDSALIGLAHLAVGAGVIAWTLRIARDPAPRLVLDADGVWYREWGTRAIPWEQIGDVYTSGSRMSSAVCVEVRDAERLLAIVPAGDRQKFKANRLVNLPRLFIPNNAVDAPLDALLGDIRAGAAHFRGARPAARAT
jgi:hypothetical protein